MNISKNAARRDRGHGFTLIELLLSMTIGATVLIGLLSTVSESLHTDFIVRQRLSLARQADFTMHRLSNAIGKTQLLILPLVDNPNTAWNESIRDVLAVTLDPTLDRDGDGWADANNDKDFQDINRNGVKDSGEWERIDEDTNSDMTNDGKSGIIGIDDDGDGFIDEDGKNDDDEDGSNNEEEENDKIDDDEDGIKNEDWLDPVVFYLNGTDLIERTPTINPNTGADYFETIIASRVSAFKVSRRPIVNKRATLVSIDITITADDGESFNLSTTVAAGDFL